jgi:hypothetical protein
MFAPAYRAHERKGTLVGYVVVRSAEAQAKGWTDEDIKNELNTHLRYISCIPDTDEESQLPKIWVVLSVSQIDILIRGPLEDWTEVEKSHLAQCRLRSEVEFPWKFVESGESGPRKKRYHRVWSEPETVIRYSDQLIPFPTLSSLNMIELPTNKTRSVLVSTCLRSASKDELD